MAQYGEWNRKGATLSDLTASKKYGVSREFIEKGIRARKLEYRFCSVHGNPYTRILRGQLETDIAEELGSQQLSSKKESTELRKIKSEIGSLKKQLSTELGFFHPVSEVVIHWEIPLPADLLRFVKKLQNGP